MASAAGVAGVRSTLDLGSKNFKCVQCGEPDSARITRDSEVGRRAVKLTENAQPALLKNSTTSRSQGQNADYSLKWISGHWGVSHY